jgi:predicted membrane-bound spermidine synthase
MLAALSILFFLSGSAALIYQILWLRLLGLVFGVTVYAASTVLAAFMAGLALGSLLAGRLADRVRHPLRWFAAAECGIALGAIASPWMLGALERAYVAWFPSLPAVSGAVTVVRLLMAGAALIVPTLLMGTTLPLVLRSSLVTGGKLGSRLGVLYASNTTGAIVGTLMSGLWLIPAYGISRTFLAAAAVNGVVAIGAIALSVLHNQPLNPAEAGFHNQPEGWFHLKSHNQPEGWFHMTSHNQPAGWFHNLRLAVLVTFAISGFVSIGAEVVWFRVAVLIIRPTVYAFAVMLATILGGIAIGSYVIAPAFARSASFGPSTGSGPSRAQSRDGEAGSPSSSTSDHWLRRLAVIEFLIAIAIVLSVAALQLGPDLARRAQPVLSRIMPPYLPFLVVHSVLMLFPSALLMGIAFPIGARLWARAGPEGSGAGDVGRFYAVNVCGGIAGSLVAGFLLLPWLGSRNTLLVLGALTAGAAMWLMWIADSGSRKALAAAGLALFAVACVYTPDPFAVFLAQRFPGQRVIWREEGVQSTVSVHEVGSTRSLHLDGNHQASTSGGTVSVHRRIGGLGMAIHANPRKTLVIGLGGGATAGAVSRFPFAEVDVIELSGAVVKAAPFFNSINNNLLERTNVHVHVDDGRNFLMLGRRKYDLITADIILPIHAGAGNVYSQEYFRLVSDALDDDGIAVQWVAGTEQEYKLIARTFLSVFPHTTVWADGSLMVGSHRPLQLKAADFDWKLAVPGARAALQDLGYPSFDALVAQYRGGPADLGALVGPGPVLTDDRPLVEYFLSLDREGSIDLSGLRPDARAILAPRP